MLNLSFCFSFHWTEWVIFLLFIFLKFFFKIHVNAVNAQFSFFHISLTDLLNLLKRLLDPATLQCLSQNVSDLFGMLQCNNQNNVGPANHQWHKTAIHRSFVYFVIRSGCLQMSNNYIRRHCFIRTVLVG